MADSADLVVLGAYFGTGSKGAAPFDFALLTVRFVFSGELFMLVAVVADYGYIGHSSVHWQRCETFIL